MRMLRMLRMTCAKSWTIQLRARQVNSVQIRHLHSDCSTGKGRAQGQPAFFQCVVKEDALWDIGQMETAAREGPSLGSGAALRVPETVPG
ncbi:MAG: hypothetical protein AMK72_05025 [Planctomycetes bacterium SM23_25]|nr:MAG: hypothetical protein AMK72_05025 [Planctomycetes bacterium SM23_25]